MKFSPLAAVTTLAADQAIQVNLGDTEKEAVYGLVLSGITGILFPLILQGIKDIFNKWKARKKGGSNES